MANERDLAIKLIQEFEGCRLTAYPDPATGAHPWTIGWGSTGPTVARGVTWTQAQCDAALGKEVDRLQAKIRALTIHGASMHQIAALTSFAYNLGIGNLASSTLLRLHNEGKFAEAAKQFRRWNKAAGKVMAGLTRRRDAEAAVYAEDDHGA